MVAPRPFFLLVPPGPLWGNKEMEKKKGTSAAGYATHDL